MEANSRTSIRKATTTALFFALSLTAAQPAVEWNAWDEQIHTATAHVRAAEYDKAEALLRSLIAGLKRRNTPADQERSAVAWNNLGWIHHELGRDREAERCYRGAIRMWEKSAGGGQPAGLAEPLDNLGQLLAVRGRFREAEKLLRRCLRLREKHDGPDHPRLAGVLNSFAVVRHGVGDIGSAVEALLSAYRIVNQYPNALGAERASIRYNLGDLYRQQKRYSDAGPHLRAALEIWRGVSGETHPDYAEGLFGLARLYADRGECEHAEALLRQALSILEQSLGAEHPRLAPVLEVYSHVARRNGRKTEARAHQGRARALRQTDARTTFRRHSIDVSELTRGR